MKPAIGRIVHFHDLTSPTGAGMPYVDTFAAIITAVHSDTCVNLTIFYPNGDTRGVSSVSLDGDVGTHTPYSWSWPPRV